jgi:hypothetical protein
MVIMATPQYQTQAHHLKSKTDIRFATMLRGIVTFFLALAWFVSPAVEAAGSPQVSDSAKTSVRTATAPAAKHAKGLLWKIEKTGVMPSYLFGTIHSDDPRVTALPDAVATAFDNSHSFTMEALIDSSSSILEMAEAMFFNDTRTLAGVLGKELYMRTIQAMHQHGLPVEGIEKQKPWVVIMALSMPQPKTGQFLDLMLKTRATLRDKPVYGLESVKEQIAVFDDLPMEEQITLLKETLGAQDKIEAQFEELTRAYLQRDLMGLMEITEEHNPKPDALAERFMDRLLAQRNVRMAERLTPRLKEGNAFIAVGAAHLPGPQGLLNLLEKVGYRVTSIY